MMSKSEYAEHRRIKRLRNIEKARAYERSMREKHKVKRREKRHAKRLSSPEITRAIERAYREKNSAKCQERTLRWRGKNPEAFRESIKKSRPKFRSWYRVYYTENREKILARSQKYRETNLEACKAAQRASYRRAFIKSPEKFKARDLKRRALEKAGGHATGEEIRTRVASLGGRCIYCGGPYEHLDHLIPLSKGGTGWSHNLVPSCAGCNLAKGDLMPGEWMTKKFGLRAAS